jgi:hypothetical protein
LDAPKPTSPEPKVQQGKRAAGAPIRSAAENTAGAGRIASCLLLALAEQLLRGGQRVRTMRMRLRLPPLQYFTPFQNCCRAD